MHLVVMVNKSWIINDLSGWKNLDLPNNLVNKILNNKYEQNIRC